MGKSQGVVSYLCISFSLLSPPPPKFIDLLVNKEPLQKAKRKRLNQGRQNKQQQQQRQREGTKKHKAENTETQVSTSAD